MNTDSEYQQIIQKIENLLKQQNIEKSKGNYVEIKKLLQEINAYRIGLEKKNLELQKTNQTLIREKDKYSKLSKNAASEIEMKMRNKLLESENRMRTLFEKIGVPMLLINPETGQIEDANYASSDFYGYSIDKLKSLNISEINQLSEREILAEMGDTKKSQKKYFNFKHRLANGQIQDVEVYSTAITFDNADKLISIILDITNRKNAEAKVKNINTELSETITELNSINKVLKDINEELKQSNKALQDEREQFLSILNSIPENIYVADIDTHIILFANKHLTKAIGRDITGETCYNAIQGKSCVCDFCTNGHIKNTDEPHFWEHYSTTLNKYFYTMNRKIQWTDNREVRFELAIDITERKKVEEKNKKLTVAVEQSPATIVITDLGGNIEYVNPAFTKTTGYSYEEAIGQNPRILKSEKTPDDIYKELWNTISSGKIWEGHFINKTKRGSEFIERAVIAPILTKNGKKTHYVAIKEDVTEKVKIQNKIKRNEEVLSIAFENANIGIVNIDLDGKILYANEECVNIFGYSKEELTSMSVNSFAIPRDKDISNDFIRSALKSEIKEKAVFEKSYYHKNGNIITCEISSTLLYDENNEPLYFISHIKDITQQQQAGEKLRKSEEKYRLITENVSDVILTFNITNNKSTYFSPSIYSIYGYTQEEALSIPFENFFLPDYASKAREMINTLSNEFAKNPIEISKQSIPFEAQALHKNGSVFWIEIRNSFRFNKDNETELVAIIREITKRKEQEKIIEKQNNQLKEAMATKDKFFNIIAHDLRNPFHSILGFSDLLINNIDNYDNKEIKQFVTIINDSGKNTFKLLENLLEWARSQQDNISFNPTENNLYLLVYETYMHISRSAKDKNIMIDLNIEKDIKIHADSEMFKTIIRNLVSNAIKFTSENGRITISAKQINNEVIIDIGDTGTGMDEQTKNSLFKIGSTKSLAGTRGERGTGFGLLLCKEFVEKHNGKISVKSELGVGSIFSVILPLQQKKQIGK